MSTSANVQCQVWLSKPFLSANGNDDRNLSQTSSTGSLFEVLRGNPWSRWNLRPHIKMFSTAPASQANVAWRQESWHCACVEFPWISRIDNDKDVMFFWIGRCGFPKMGDLNIAPTGHLLQGNQWFVPLFQDGAGTRSPQNRVFQVVSQLNQGHSTVARGYGILWQARRANSWLCLST